MNILRLCFEGDIDMCIGKKSIEGEVNSFSFFPLKMWDILAF